MAKGNMKEIAVIGLGKFGESVARTYSEAGGMVLAIDKNSDRVQEIESKVTYAVKADVTDADVVRKLGLSNMDVVVVAITSNLDAAVMATILSKEEGVPFVLAKAQNEIHAKVLEKVGADKIIFPEKESGARVSRQLRVDNLMDLVDLSDDHSIVEVPVPKSWVGKSLIEVDVRRQYGLNIIGCRRDGRIDVNISPSKPFTDDMLLIIIGENKQIDKVFGQ